jgi:hypothetical protein
MDTYDQLSLETLKRILKEVTGEDYDETSSEGRGLVLARIQELLSSDERDYATEFAESFFKQTHVENYEAEGLPRVVYKIVKFEEAAEEYDPDDLPSRAAQTPSSLDVTASADEVVSPKRLGFDYDNVEVKWSSQSLRRWTTFISSVEHKIPNKITFASLKSLVSSLNRKIAYKTEHKAKNYDLVFLEDGEDKSIAHFLFGSKHLYVVVIVNNSETFRSKVALDDVNGFSKEIASAFKGRPELAKGTLSHLLSALNHEQNVFH